MPKWGIEMQQGTLVAWLVAAGQKVSPGEPLAEVETEKIVNSIEAPAAGIVRRILAQTGERYDVGALLGVLAAGDVADQDIDAFIVAFEPPDARFGPEATTDIEVPRQAPAASAAPNSEPRPPAPKSVHASPLAERLAAEHGIDLTLVRGTGRNGRISKQDVDAYIASAVPAAAATAGTAGSGERLSATRAVIARRVSQSTREIPHYRLTAELNVSALFRERQRLNVGGTKVTLNDLLVRTAAIALTRHPILNAHFVAEEIIRFAHVDIAIAVATQAGVMTPVVRAADTKSAAALAAEIRDLARRARDGTLTSNEIAGGTFSVSNLGAFGITQFDAIINPPQVAILAVGAAIARVVRHADGTTVAPMMLVTLSCDHRIVDGADGASFLRTLKELIESCDDL